jgi:hypothetical protein
MPPKTDDDVVPRKKEGECVKVVVRVRPLSKKEIQDGHDEATQADEDSGAYLRVLRCLHAVDATRLQERRRWVVSFPISSARRSHHVPEPQGGC